MGNIKNIIKETVNNFVTEATKSDRHEYWAKRWKEQKKLQKEHPRSNEAKKADRHEYWAERWKRQKEAQAEAEAQGTTTVSKPKKKSSNKKDRHKPGYYRRYNWEHPERLRRIGIDPDYIQAMRDFHDCDELGDDGDVAMGRVTLDPECYEDYWMHAHGMTTADDWPDRW
jgi:hypothetical protein